MIEYRFEKDYAKGFPNMKIVVLGGGISTERQVALVTSASVCKALRSLGHKAIFVDMYFGLEDYNGALEDAFDAPDGFCASAAIDRTAPDLEAVKASRKLKSPSRIGKNVLEICALADCVFLGLHGADGEDGKIQAALDLMGIPYTGSGHLGSAMAMDKAVAKRIMESAGVLTPKWREIVYSKEDIPTLVNELPVPCVVKAVNGGSSIGVALPDTKEELKKALNEILLYNNRIIVEEKITGREFTQTVLGDKYLSAIEIVPPEGNTFDYVAKYQSGSLAAREICPAPITEKEQKTLGEAAMRFHKALGLSVYSRSDFIIDKNGNAYCLEVNTLPGMTPNSLIPKAAKVEGIGYPELCEKIVMMSIEARKKGL